ncbi:c-type cytochrome [Martelella endophytica]|uniref:c-type cytochrome n=1 Tax=Martelella endophytica TaxID=1486262 RepID=UPI000A6FEB57|nr:cytochrome c [Martelella endophytica]
MTISKALPRLFIAALAFGAGPALAQTVEDPALMARGQYLSIAGDCGACHTATKDKPFGGGLPLSTPLGEIFSTNITPSTTAGIGNYSLEEFDRAVRHGERKDGRNLYPAMPYTSYATITDYDLKALYTYFMHGVDPVDEEPSRTRLPFPFNLRFTMKAWNLIFARGAPFQNDPTRSEEWNRGAYLSQSLAHCSTCHTPRNFLMAEEEGKALAGASLGTWFAPNITSDPIDGIGVWSISDITAYLSTGRSPTGSQAGGPMLEAINNSLSQLHDRDITAIATYIHDVAPQPMNASPPPNECRSNGISDHGLCSGRGYSICRRDALWRSLRDMPSVEWRGPQRSTGNVWQRGSEPSPDSR